jgi:hypothetical protein
VQANGLRDRVACGVSHKTTCVPGTRNAITPSARPTGPATAQWQPPVSARVINEPRRIAVLPPGPPLLMVVVDTEEEFDWALPFNRASTTVHNVAGIGAAHAIFRPFGLKPTYVIDYPVATTPESAALLRDMVAAGECLVGAHLHPWVCPPHDETVSARNSYHGNLPAALEHAKIARLTAAIEQGIGIRPDIFKAGRYGLGPHTGASLRALGYGIDLSVLPCTDLREEDGGPDFRLWPDRPFYAGAAEDIFSIPLSRGFYGSVNALVPLLSDAAMSDLGTAVHLPGLLHRTGLLTRATLTPEGHGFAEHRRLIASMMRRGHRAFTINYHSPSLTPGQTPYVRTQVDLDRFMDTLKQLADYFFNDLGAIPVTPPELRAMAS